MSIRVSVNVSGQQQDQPKLKEQRFSHATVSCRGGNDKQSSHALQRRHDPRNTHREATGRQKRGWTQSGGGLLAYKRAFTRASGERTEIQISHKYETNAKRIKDKSITSPRMVRGSLACDEFPRGKASCC